MKLVEEKIQNIFFIFVSINKLNKLLKFSFFCGTQDKLLLYKFLINRLVTLNMLNQYEKYTRYGGETKLILNFFFANKFHSEKADWGACPLIKALSNNYNRVSNKFNTLCTLHILLQSLYIYSVTFVKAMQLLYIVHGRPKYQDIG